MISQWEWRDRTNKNGRQYLEGIHPDLECYIQMSGYANKTSTTFWLPGARKVSDRYWDDERFTSLKEARDHIDQQPDPMRLYEAATPRVEGKPVRHARDDMAASYVQQPRPVHVQPPLPLSDIGDSNGKRALTGNRIYVYRRTLLLPIAAGFVDAVWDGEFYAIGGWFPTLTTAMQWLDKRAKEQDGV